MNENTITPPEQNKILTALNFIILSVMLTLFAFMLRGTIQAIYPEWQTTGLLIVAFIVSFESLVVQHLLHAAYDSFQRRLPTTLAELILISLAAKILTMVAAQPISLWQEVSSWQQDFAKNFFDADFILSIMTLLIIWMLSRVFSSSLTQLEEDKSLMEQEKSGRVFTDRQVARRRLVNLIFGMGFAMMVLMVITNSSPALSQTSGSTARGFFITLLVYFFSGFLFIAINQYNIMRTRWYLNDVPVNPNLAKRWVFYSIIFITGAVLLVVFLPTEFTLGLLPVIQAIYEGIVIILGILELIIFLPVVLALSVISSLETGEPLEQEIEETLPEFTTITQQAASTVGWWEVLKSVLFWLVFLGIIIFAIIYYFRNRKEFGSFFNKIKVGEWLKDFWRWISTGFNKLKHTAAETLQKNMKNIRAFFQRQKVKLPAAVELFQDLPARQMVILTYINWIRWSRRHGFHRKESQTPYEYAVNYTQELPEAAQAVDTLTNTFILARYSRQSIDRSSVQTAQSSLTNIKEIFQTNQVGKQ